MFSRYARMRLMRLIAHVDWTEFDKGIFVTLTYPDYFADRTAKQRTQDRSWFMRDIENFTGKKIPVIWRTEWVERKSGKLRGQLAPHHHLMLMGIPYIFWKDLRRIWGKVLAWHDDLVTHVRTIEGPESCGRYLCKYIAKNRSLDYGAYLNKHLVRGRQWGVMRKDLLTMRPVDYDEEISEEVYDQCIQARAELDHRDSPMGYSSFSVLGEIRKMQFLAGLQKRIEAVSKVG